MSDTTAERSRAGDLASLAIATCGVGYLPLAPGTWGSILGVAIYIAAWFGESKLGSYLLQSGWNERTIGTWLGSANLIVLLGIIFAAIWASGRAGRVWGEKDPQRAVIDEVVGQLVVFFYIPFTTSWWLIASGFVLFRFFDIVKPYPINKLQDLPGGLGVCADDIVAGIYAGILLKVIYTISISF